MIEAERLIEVTDMLVDAVTEIAEQTGGPIPYPSSLISQVPPIESLRGVTYDEAKEASAFMVRLGLIERRRSISRDRG